MSSPLADVLAEVDLAKARSSAPKLQALLKAVASVAEPAWTGPLEGVLGGLADVGRVDLCLARLLEGHVDALRILDEAGARPGPGVYGVWASRSAGTGLRARPTAGGWILEGELRFASGIGLIDRSLVTASLDDRHLLFDLDLGSRADDIFIDESSWNTAGMDATRSFTVRVETPIAADAQVGGTDFYLSRPGFAIGGLRVAAVWAGGARQVVDAVVEGLSDFTPTAHQCRRLGLMAQAVWAADLAVSSTAAALGGLAADKVAGEIDRARTAVVLGCDTVLEHAALVVGPGGLSTSQRLVRACGDLAIYIRQHHLDAVAARLGADLVAAHERQGS